MNSPAVRAGSVPASQASLSLYLVYFVYFFCGMTQCFESVFLPEFKAWFHLNYQQQMYTMLAKNIPFLLAAAIGIALPRIGYRRSLNTAILFYALGTFLLVPAIQQGRFSVLLAGFFLIGVGFNIQLVAGNPLILALGPPSSSSSRLNLANALGAVAQIIAPALLAFLIPAAAATVAARVPYMRDLFAVLAILLLGLAGFTLFIRDPQPAAAERSSAGGKLPARVYLGLAAIILALGAEACLFGFFRNVLEDTAIAGLPATSSQLLFTVFLALFAVGRLAAAWLQRKVQPALYLTVTVLAAIASVLLLVFAHGILAAVVLTCSGFWFAAFFPTLYALAIAGLGEQTARASGVLTMGFLGCAFFPVLQGRLADTVGLQRSFVFCAAAYALIALYALNTWRQGRADTRPS